MKNPFKVGETVLTNIKRKAVQGTINQIWKNEVQVKTAEGELLWRTMYTVWRPGAAPLARPTKQPKIAAPSEAAGSNGKVKKAVKVTPGAKPSKKSKNARRRR